MKQSESRARCHMKSRTFRRVLRSVVRNQYVVSRIHRRCRGRLSSRSRAVRRMSTPLGFPGTLLRSRKPYGFGGAAEWGGDHCSDMSNEELARVTGYRLSAIPVMATDRNGVHRTYQQETQYIYTILDGSVGGRKKSARAWKGSKLWRDERFSDPIRQPPIW